MTTYAQLFCSTAELIADLHLTGAEPELLSRIRSASSDLANAIGNFIPVVETRTFYPNRIGEIYIDPVIVVVQVLNDTTLVSAGSSTVDGYTLEPGQRCYPHGPYSRIQPGAYPWSSYGVHITAYWGKFEEIRAVAVDAVTQTDSAATLVLSDGSKGSAGMVLLLDTEQELIVGGNGDQDSPGPSEADSLLIGPIAANDEEISVTDGTEFKRGEVIRISTEDCMIRRIVGDILVVARGWNGTTKAAHIGNSAIFVYRTFAVLRGVNGTTAIAHNSEPIYRYTVPDDVNWMARQVAGLMRMKAAVGFANKSGNAELGETFYYSEFPNQIAKIKANYQVY